MVTAVPSDGNGESVDQMSEVSGRKSDCSHVAARRFLPDSPPSIHQSLVTVHSALARFGTMALASIV